MADIADVTAEDFEPQVLKADQPVFVYYYAPWCKPCQEMTDDLKAAADEAGIKVVQVNTDRQAQIVRRQRIRTIPQLQLVSGGRVIDTIRGKLSKQELAAKLGEAPSGESTEDQAQA